MRLSWPAGLSATIVLLIGCVPPSVGAAASTQPPVAPAAAFSDSVGVNVHMYYDDTPYRDADAVTARLKQLGVLHVRDGLTPGRPDQIAAIKKLAAAGIYSNLIVGTPGYDPSPLLNVVGSQLSDAVRSIEGPNEYWMTGDGWEDRLVPFQQELFDKVHGDPRTSAMTVVGASVGGIDLSSSLDVGNIHPYPGGRAPEGLVESELRSARTTSSSKPVWATETGYHDAVNMERGAGQPATSDAAQAVYIPRLVASYFAAGVKRTYLYELLDEFDNPGATDPEKRFGLLRHDMTPKPQFNTLARLMALVGKDQDWTTRPLEAQVVDADPQLRTVLLSKDDGSFRMLIWRAQTVNASGVPTATASSARIELPADAAISVQDLTAGGEQTLCQSCSSTSLTVGPAIRVVSIKAPRSPGPSTLPTLIAPPSPSPTPSPTTSPVKALPIASATASSVRVLSGRRKSGSVRSLRTSDGRALAVASGGRRTRSAGFSADVPRVPRRAQSLTVMLAASATSKCAARVSAYDWSRRRWKSLGNHKVSRTSQLTTHAAGDATRLVSGGAGAGKVRLRIRCVGAKRTSSFVYRSDLLRLAWAR